MTSSAPERAPPGGCLFGGIVTCRLVAGTVAIGSSTVTEDIVLAGQIIVERTGIGTAAVIGSSGEADFQIAIDCTGGMRKGGVVRVTFLAVAGAGIILVVFGVASSCTARVGRNRT